MEKQTLRHFREVCIVEQSGVFLFILSKFYARVMGFHESGNGQGKQYFCRSVKSQGICYFRYIKIQLNSEA